MVQQKKKQKKPKKLFKYLEKTQIDEVLERARNNGGTRNYLILLTLFRTGMRCDDLTSFTKRDIKSDRIVIRQGKGKKDRQIPLEPTLKDLLMFYCSSIGLDEKLFPISNAQVRNICHKYQGEHNIHPHTFRHSFAVHYLKSGGNIRCLQKILGHKDLNTTAVYLDLIANDIIDDFKKIEW
jgi:site-specific recombinase XerD